MDTDDELYKASRVITDTLMNTLSDSDEELLYTHTAVSQDSDLDHLDTSIDSIASGQSRKYIDDTNVHFYRKIERFCHDNLLLQLLMFQFEIPGK